MSFGIELRCSSGGGWCYSDSECYERSKGVLGSSNAYPPTLDLSQNNAMFMGPSFEQISNNMTVNPFLFSFSKIFLPYGDGTSQVSDLADPVPTNNSTIYYRGARVIKELISRIAAGELAGATDIIVGGSSAGGLSTYLCVVD